MSGAIGAINPSSGFPILPPNPTNPVPTIIFHGKRDRLIPYGGRQSGTKSRLHFLSVEDAVDFWVGNNKCSKEPIEDLMGGGVVRTSYSGCDADSDVILYTFEDGGHSWPRGRVHLSGDEPNKDISATDLIWDFFKKHPKKGR